MDKNIKPVLHFKFNKEKQRIDEVAAFMKFINEKLGKDYYVIASPFELESTDETGVIKNCNIEDISLDDVLENNK